jgi:hypothetical protein
METEYSFCLLIYDVLVQGSFIGWHKTQVPKEVTMIPMYGCDWPSWNFV